MIEALGWREGAQSSYPELTLLYGPPVATSLQIRITESTDRLSHDRDDVRHDVDGIRHRPTTHHAAVLELAHRPSV